MIDRSKLIKSFNYLANAGAFIFPAALWQLVYCHFLLLLRKEMSKEKESGKDNRYKPGGGDFSSKFQVKRSAFSVQG